MAIAFRGNSSPVQANPASSVTLSLPTGTSVGDMLLLVLGFEGRASGSGPWVDPSGSGPNTGVVGEGSGWKRVCYQAPSATGNGLEVWSAIYGSGSTHTANFTGSYSALAIESAWSGVYAPAGVIFDGAVRASATDQWTGDDPECPSLYAYANELLIAVGAQTLDSPGWGTPTPAGWTKRQEDARNGSFANVSVVIADKLVAAEGTSGAIPFSATAASGSTRGTTATIAIRPATMLPVATSPLIAVEYAVPL